MTLMRKTKKVMEIALMSLLIGANTIPVLAVTAPSEKEEVVYIGTDASGDVENVNVVNIFKGGNITDYGNYRSVKMLTSNDAIKQQGDTITFSTDDEKVYYQGTLDHAQIPWDITIQYYLDGKQYEPTKLAGKSGALEIRFQVTKNKASKGSFYEDYALQASFTLDTNQATNIVAKEATVANVGADKQLTYTILPGEGINTAIKANVTNFEMSAVTINGIKLNLNLEIDDKELMEKVSEIMDATKQLNQGVDRVYEGSDKLLSGSSNLNAGLSSLKSGVSELDNGIVTLQRGVVSMQQGLDALNSKSSDLTNGSAKVKEALQLIQSNLNSVSVTAEDLSQLTTSSSAIKQGINQLYAGIQKLKENVSFAQYKNAMAANGLDINTVKAGNIDAIQTLTSQIDSLRDSIAKMENMPGYENQVSGLKAQVESLQKVMQLLTGSNAVIAGTEGYLNELSNAVSSLSEGAASLKNNYEAFDQAIIDLTSTLSGLTVKVSKLTEGINQLVANYGDLDTGLNQYTNAVAQIAGSYEQIVDGVAALATGSNKLLKGSGNLSSGAEEIYKGVAALCNGASELAEGSGEFYNRTSDMDTQVQEQLDEILSSIEGDKTETKSFVSPKNTNVDSVQFVIKTAAIEAPEVKQEEVKEEKQESFWQKLLHLFGIGKK